MKTPNVTPTGYPTTTGKFTSKIRWDIVIYAEVKRSGGPEPVMRAKRVRQDQGYESGYSCRTFTSPNE